MNSESEQRLSLQELKQRNTQQTAAGAGTTSEARPTKADWERMMKYGCTVVLRNIGRRIC